MRLTYDRRVFASRLSKLRDERGLSQEELGARIGVNKATISKYEANINPPKLGHALALADVLHVSFLYSMRYFWFMWRGFMPSHEYEGNK